MLKYEIQIIKTKQNECDLRIKKKSNNIQYN